MMYIKAKRNIRRNTREAVLSVARLELDSTCNWPVGSALTCGHVTISNDLGDVSRRQITCLSIRVVRWPLMANPVCATQPHRCETAAVQPQVRRNLPSQPQHLPGLASSSSNSQTATQDDNKKSGLSRQVHVTPT